MDQMDEKIVLALETALDGGSVAILGKGRQIESATGAGSLSKSEDILPIIENLLKKNGIEKKEIGLIAVSDGPGSLTGLRIGLAIARGLGDALGAKVYKISVLEAQTYRANSEGRVISALYTKKSGVFYREFLIEDGKRIESGETMHFSEPMEFVDKLEELSVGNISFVIDHNLSVLLADHFQTGGALERKSFFPVEGNLAETIARAVFAVASDNV